VGSSCWATWCCLFLAPVAWAIILAYVTWPAYQRLRSLLRGNVTGSALLMTVILTAAFVVPVVWLIMLLRSELGGAYQAVAAYLVNGPSLMGSTAIATAEEQASATETAMRNQDDLSASMRYLLGLIRSKKKTKKSPPTNQGSLKGFGAVSSCRHRWRHEESCINLRMPKNAVSMLFASGAENSPRE
jgi:hypothetical protein